MNSSLLVEGREHLQGGQGDALLAGGSVRPRLPEHSQSCLVDDVEQVLGVHCQGVGSRQHLLLVLLLEAGHDVLLGQLHLADELAQVRVQQLLRHLDLSVCAGREDRDGLIHSGQQCPQGQADFLHHGHVLLRRGRLDPAGHLDDSLHQACHVLVHLVVGPVQVGSRRGLISWG